MQTHTAHIFPICLTRTYLSLITGGKKGSQLLLENLPHETAGHFER